MPQSNMNKCFANVVLKFIEKIDLETFMKDFKLNTLISMH